jgi:hypothetical protein
MITKEELKKEIDKLPESILNEVYSYLTQKVKPTQKKINLTPRNFGGKLDDKNLRELAYE